jgi:hypothetical protein
MMFNYLPRHCVWRRCVGDNFVEIFPSRFMWCQKNHGNTAKGATLPEFTLNARSQGSSGMLYEESIVRKCEYAKAE